MEIKCGDKKYEAEWPDQILTGCLLGCGCLVPIILFLAIPIVLILTFKHC